jgi:folate-dependent phosphoribosylglycinamide formyltransferase PurN
MKVILLTSNSLRHKYIAHSLAKQLDLELVITEKKSLAITDTKTLNNEDALFIEQHFLERRSSEEKYFGMYPDFPSTSAIMDMDHGQINSQEVSKATEKLQPDYIILFGTSIINNVLLTKYPGRIINLHLGLSPYFRGSATNLFPYYYEEPECIGGTIHLATAEVDNGEILHQFRPDISLDNNLHDIGNKVILKGGKILPEILKKYDRGYIKPIKQKGSGRLCKNKDLNPKILRAIYIKLREGLLKDYLENKEKRDAKKPILK